MGSGPGRRATLIGGAFALACGVGFAVSATPSVAIPTALAAIGAGLVVGAIGRGGALAALAVGVALALGLLRGSLAVVLPGPGTIDGHFAVHPLILEGTVRSSDPVTGSNAIVDATHIAGSDTDRSVSGGVLVTGPLVPALSPGDRVEVDAAGLRPLNRRPGADSAGTLERDGVEAMAISPQVFVLAAGGVSVAGAVADAQQWLTSAVDREVAEPAAALLLGIAFGIHQPLSSDVRTPLQDAGLIHVVVVSGLKVVLIVGLLGAMARTLQWSPRQTLLIVVPVVTAYVVVSGAGPAAIRSAVMAGTGLLASSGGRRTDPIPLLALVAAVMLGLTPALIEDPGFQLSFVGTAGILLLAAPIAGRLPGPRLLAEPFAVTVAAQIATVPVMAGTFGVIALGGPLANALVLPLLPIMIVSGGAGAILSALHPGWGWVLLQGTAAGTALITTIARVIAGVPGAAVQIGNWPAAWSLAEVAALFAALAVLALSSRERRGAP
ncbi:MAG: ComEC/Rec2 family competence protein [Candidatus Dormiibacterota bacterium]